MKPIIVFLEDNPTQIRHHIESVRVALADIGKDVDFYVCRNLLHAVKFVNEYHARIQLLVIDLYISGSTEALAEYRALVPDGINRNQGQLFAAFIHDKYSEIPYLYLSNFPSGAYTGEEKDKVYDKNPNKMDCFLEKVKEILCSKEVR